MSEAKVKQVRGPRRRKPMSLAAKIRQATEQGMSAKEIAKRYKADIGYVYQTQWEFKKKQKTPLPPPAGATIDFHFDASSQALVPVTSVESTTPDHVKNVETSTQKNTESGGIVWLIDQKEAAPKPAAVEERKLTLWERFKFWAFGIRA
jgi:hypothetical protein